MTDLTVFNMSAGLRDFKPPQIAQGLVGADDGSIDGVLNAIFRCAHQFDDTVDYDAQVGLPDLDSTLLCGSQNRRRYHVLLPPWIEPPLIRFLWSDSYPVLLKPILPLEPRSVDKCAATCRIDRTSQF